MQEENDFFGFWGAEGGAQDFKGVPDVGCAVVKRPFDKYLYDVEQDSGRAVVHADDWALEDEREEIDVGLEPVSSDCNAVDEYPFLGQVFFLTIQRMELSSTTSGWKRLRLYGEHAGI